MNGGGSQQLKYRNKDVKGGKKFYVDVRDIVDEFTENSEDMLHRWSTGMVEGMMNKFFTKFLPKDRTYGMTIENQVRICLAICIDSVGYHETNSRLAKKARTEMGHHVQAEMNRLLDFEKECQRNYRKRAYVKKVRKTKFYDKLCAENSEKLIKENKKRPFQEDTVRPTKAKGEKAQLNSRAERGGKIEFQCPHCDLWGHQRVSLKACLPEVYCSHVRGGTAPILVMYRNSGQRNSNRRPLIQSVSI
jgi:hypothetical protein